MKAATRPSRSAASNPGLRGKLAVALLASGLLGAAPPCAHAVDGGPTVTIGSSVPDAATGTTIISDIKIVYPGGNASTIVIGKLKIKELKQTSTGFQADEILAQDLVVTAASAGLGELRIPEATLLNVAGPAITAATLATDTREGALPPLASLLLAIKVDAILLPAVDLPGSGQDNAHYTNVGLSQLSNGKVAHLGFDAVETGSASKARMTIGKSQIKDLDFGAYAVWFDDTLAAAAAPGLKPIYSSFDLNHLVYKDEKGSGSVDRISSSDFKLAPLGMKPSELLSVIKRLRSDSKYGDDHPAEVVKLIRTLLPSFALGNIQMEGIAVDEKPDAPFSVGLVRLEALSGTGIGEIRFGDMKGITKDEDKAPFALGSMSMRNIGVANLDPFLDKIAAGILPGAIGFDEYPKFRASGFAMTDFNADIPGKGRTRFGGFTVDTPSWMGFLPTTLSVHLAGLSMPLANIDDPQSRAAFEQLGIKTVGVSSDINLAWKETDQTLTLGPSSFNIDQFAKFTVDGTIGNVPKSVFFNPTNSLFAMFGFDFRGASLHVADNGGLSKMIDITVKQQKTDVQTLALGAYALAQSQLADFIGPDSSEQLGAALRAFILNPQSLAIDVKTSKPLSIAPLLAGGAQISDAERQAIRNTISVDAKAN
jgi:hypothetical protein